MLSKDQLYRLNPEITSGVIVYSFSRDLTEDEYKHTLNLIKTTVLQNHKTLVIGHDCKVTSHIESHRLKTVVDTLGWDIAQVEFPEIGRLLNTNLDGEQ